MTRAVERVLYLTAAMTGLRQGELLALRWRDVDWPARARPRAAQLRARRVRHAEVAARLARAVPLADRARRPSSSATSRRSAFQATTTSSSPTRAPGEPLDRSELRKRFKAALRRAGVREVRFHDLRHTFGTRMAAAGVPMRTLQEWMGHRDFKTTLIYADYQPAEREAELVDGRSAPAARGPIGGPIGGPF